MAKDNLSIIKRGRSKANAIIDLQLYDLCRRLAVISLSEAVNAWDEDTAARDLTGNLRTSFASAVYKDKRLMVLFNVFNIGENIEHPTHGMTFVGDTGFRVYGENWYIGADSDPYVREYKDEHLWFQPTIPGEYGYNMTTAALNAYKPSNNGFEVVVATVTPYGEYLRNVRKLDILESQSAGDAIARNLSEAVAATKDLDAYASRVK